MFLEHDGAVAVVGVAEGEGVGAEAVEERFLGPEIVVEGAVVVEVVACQVGEYASGEGESGYAVLVGGMAAHLHEHVRAPGVGHAAEEGVELDGVGRGVLGGFAVGVDDIGHG